MKYKKPNMKWAVFIPVLLSSIFLINATVKYQDINKKIRMFREILLRIESDYIEDVSTDMLMNDAIGSMVGNLDPHSAFLSPEQFSRLNQNFEGYHGIGITYDIIHNRITVMSVIKNGPSYKAGLLSGDRIVKINGINAVGLSREEAPAAIMGPKGTPVEVTIQRSGLPELKTITIIRDKVNLETIPYAFILSPNIGYIGITGFSSTTADELLTQMQQLLQSGMESLILDLRNNGGGYLQAAIDVVDPFLPAGNEIVYTKGRTSHSSGKAYSLKTPAFPLIPVIVLIDRISASAAEIVAGALQDWDRALIAGENSFGKGFVQSQYRFNDGSALLLTTSQYFTPSGRLIQRPYDPGNIESYFENIHNDSLRFLFKSDSSRPVYYTKILNRPIPGGGGISPDIYINPNKNEFAAVLNELAIAKEKYLYTWAEQFIRAKGNLTEMKETDFIREFSLHVADYRAFITYMRKNGFNLTSKDLLDNRDDFEFLIKQVLAQHLWGDETRYKIQLLRDQQLMDAVKYMPEAKNMLKRAYSARQ